MKKMNLFMAVAMILGSIYTQAATTTSVVCSGSFGPTPISRDFAFGDGTSDIKQIGVFNGTTYSLQLGRQNGIVDMLILAYVINADGSVVAHQSDFVRGVGATEITYGGNSKMVFLDCRIHD